MRQARAFHLLCERAVADELSCSLSLLTPVSARLCLPLEKDPRLQLAHLVRLRPQGFQGGDEPHFLCSLHLCYVAIEELNFDLGLLLVRLFCGKLVEGLLDDWPTRLVRLGGGALQVGAQAEAHGRKLSLHG